MKNTAPHFNTQAAAFDSTTYQYKLEEPVIVVNLFGLDPCSGEVHSSMGIAQRVANKTGGSIVVLNKDNPECLHQYPEGHSLSHLNGGFSSRKTDQYLLTLEQTKGLDIWIGTDMNLESGFKYMPSRHAVFQESGEELPYTLLGGRPLAVHHLTQEDLATEGLAFQAHYPAIKHPLVAIMMTDVMDSPPFLADKIARLAKQNAEGGTFFIETNHKTLPSNFHEFRDLLTAALAQHGVTNFDVTGHIYSAKDTGYNPYKGLLDQADSVIIAGRSLSMVSETLYAGKVAFSYSPSAPFINEKSTATLYADYIQSGHVIDMAHCPDDTALVQARFPSLDVVGEAADTLIHRVETLITEDMRAHLKKQEDIAKMPPPAAQSENYGHADYDPSLDPRCW